MKNFLLADKYPIHVLELAKSETPYAHLDELLQALEAKAEADPGVAMIAKFDHYAHTKLIGGEIRPDIVAAKNLIFCFGPKLPDPAMLAVRPRSIGIAELGDRYVISFLEAPLPEANRKMAEWVMALRNLE
ncbi:MAG: hypothetical protein RBS40_04955 [Rhodocyclaceae bacterium]|jgi:hypothetical protein|nr:hypothetical protein [Rhodocyclaceae bacterium]